MKPNLIELPDIYRGCIYPPIFFYWKTKDGEAFNLVGYVPLCFGKDFSFNCAVVNPAIGLTRIVLNQQTTKELRLGKQAWDWLWISGTTIYPPILSGVVTVRNPISDVSPPPLPDVPDD
jgi:hypothetical protein